MLRQYYPQRFRYQQVGDRFLPVGTIPVGTTFTATNVESGRTRRLIVDAWFPREISAARRIRGRWVNGYVANGGHLALVRDLDTGKSFKLADHFIRFCLDND